MRFALTPEQRDFFRKNQFIEFEGLLSKPQAASIDKQAEEILARRLKIPSSKWDTTPTLSLYKAGFDLWREAEAIKKATQKLSIVHIASELFDTSPLRLAFDQLFIVASSSPPFGKSLSLTEISSVKPLAGGVLFLLEDLEESVHKSLPFPIPKTAGNALFFAPGLPLPWPALFSVPRLRFLLIAFAPEKSYYRQEQNDPHSPVFKKWGYAYNEQLKEELHPLVFGKK
jgi:hypothetical protein